MLGSAFVSLTQLEYFVAIAEAGTIGRAAKRLRVAQPPLSRNLRSLEEELGGPLFERTTRGVRLLPRGELFLARARRILVDVEAAVVEARRGPRSELQLDSG